MSIDDMGDKFKHLAQLKTLKDRIEELEAEVYTLQKTLVEYGIEDISTIDDVEAICVKGIKDLKIIADTSGLTQEEAKTLDLLHKNLRLARNLEQKEAKGKKKSVDELLKVIEGGNKKGK